MKQDINNTLNKLLVYAYDNLLLDALDGEYTLNRLANICGVAAPAIDNDADYGDATLEELLTELKTLLPTVDVAAVAELLFPMPRTVNYCFARKLMRGKDKALDFLYELYAHGYNCVSVGASFGKNGYIGYAADGIKPISAVAFNAGEELAYTPVAVANHIAMLENPDILSDDVISREVAYVSTYGGAIAARIGATAPYLCCDDFALTSAGVKTQISSGTVKVSLLDYPVPAIAFNGIAKNAVMREAARVIKAATGAGIACVAATAAKDGVTIYAVFANDIAPDAANILVCSDALAACGVFKTIDCSPLVPVLEKGTALSTDLMRFKPIYDIIGGTKYGAKAGAELGGALVDMYRNALKAANSATEEQIVSLSQTK